MKVFGYIFMAIAFYLFSMAWQNVAKQDQIIRPTVPIKVVVLDKKVKETKTGDSPSYAPSIVFSYTIGRNVYHSDRVLPVDQTRGEKQWAENIISAYSVGKTYTGYYNPNDFSKSFLLRRYTIAFYLPLFLYLGMFALGALFVCAPLKKTSPLLKPYPSLSGWYEIEPEANLPAKILTLKVLTAIWFFGSFVILGSYAFVAQPYLSIWFWVAAATAIAIGIYPTSQLFKMSQAEISISDIVVLTDVQRVISGEGHKLKIIVKATRECIIKSMTVSIYCRKRISDSEGAQITSLYENELWKMENSTKVGPGLPLTLEQILCAPAAYPKTSEDSSAKTEWNIEIKLSTEDGGEANQSHAFVVHST